MLKDKRFGLKLIIVGVLVNNYVYLNDLILDKHEGAILLGPGEWIVIVLTLIVIADGVVIVLRSQASSVAE
jgi:F0F1-type ATP synthase assembly protein I